MGITPRTKLIDGNEYDAVTRWRRFIKFKPGERAKIKRKIRRRERQEGAEWRVIAGNAQENADAEEYG